MAVDAKGLPAAAAFAFARFGGPTRLRQRTVSVGTTVTELLANDPNRLAWLIINRSPNDGALSYDRGVTTSTGIPISNTRGTVLSLVEEDGEVVTYAVFGINATAAGDYTVIEILRGRALEGT